MVDITSAGSKVKCGVTADCSESPSVCPLSQYHPFLYLSLSSSVIDLMFFSPDLSPSR